MISRTACRNDMCPCAGSVHVLFGIKLEIDHSATVLSASGRATAIECAGCGLGTKMAASRKAKGGGKKKAA